MTTILDCMTDGYTLATGKSTLPVTGSSKYGRLFALAKKLYRDWQNEPGVDWNSLYQLVNVGTVTATDTFDIDTDFWKVSQRDGDTIYVATTDGNKIPFKLVEASALYSYRYTNAVAVVGKTLVFSRAFTSDDQSFGGTLYVPLFAKLDEITSVNDDVLIDNPDWLSHAIASYYVMTDAQLNYLYPDLVNQTDQLMQTMKFDNGRNDTVVSDTDYFAGVSAGC